MLKMHILAPPSPPHSGEAQDSAFLNEPSALACVAKWVEHWPANQKAAGLTLSQGTCLGCGVWERRPIDGSLPVFLLPSL